MRNLVIFANTLIIIAILGVFASTILVLVESSSYCKKEVLAYYEECIEHNECKLSTGELRRYKLEKEKCKAKF